MTTSENKNYVIESKGFHYFQKSKKKKLEEIERLKKSIEERSK